MAKNKVPPETMKAHVTRIGALGGKARAANMTPKQRSAQARKAALARYANLTGAQRSAIARLGANATNKLKQEK